MENKYFKAGGVDSPLTTDLTNSSLRDLDPAIYEIIGFVAETIKIHCQERWDLEVVLAGLPLLVGNIVNQAIPYDPLPIKNENQWRFPLLYTCVGNSTYSLDTRTWYSITRDIEVTYVLPPLQSEQMERLVPFLAHIERVVVDRFAHGKDDQYNSGEAVWASAGIEQIILTGAQQEKIMGHKGSLESSIYFPSICFTIKCKERRNPETHSNFENCDGVVIGIDLTDC